MPIGIMGSKSFTLLYWGPWCWERRQGKLWIHGFVLFPSTCWNTLSFNHAIIQLATITHISFRHCRVRFYTFVGQPLSKQLYTIWFCELCCWEFNANEGCNFVISHYVYSMGFIPLALFHRWSRWLQLYRICSLILQNYCRFGRCPGRLEPNRLYREFIGPTGNAEVSGQLVMNSKYSNILSSAETTS